jgi:hypothetical protein
MPIGALPQLAGQAGGPANPQMISAIMHAKFATNLTIAHSNHVL